MLQIFHNPLDAGEFETRDFDCLLTEWLALRERYPTARLYKGVACLANDITPKTVDDAWALKGLTGHYQVICHAKAPAVVAAWAAVLSFAVAVYTYISMPDVKADTGVQGSPNNSLAQRQNKHRVGGRVPDNYGTVKALPDLIAPVYRIYRDNIQVEECLLCVGAGHYDIDPKLIKEGETPIDTIEGASISIYEPNQSLLSNTPQVKIGESFTDVPLVTKQISSIDGKQTLIPPNSNYFMANKVVVSSTSLSFERSYYTKKRIFWDREADRMNEELVDVNIDPTQYFNSGEQIIIDGLQFGAVQDEVVSGNTDVDKSGVLTISSTKNIPLVEQYKSIRIASMLINDKSRGDIDLAGEYPVASIVKSGSNGAWFYTVTLASGFVSINSNFALMTAQNAVSVISATLTNNTNNIDLDGTYTIASISSKQVVLVNPISVNPNWGKLGELTTQQINDFAYKNITLSGSRDNYIGWYYAGGKDTTGFLLNFVAQNGIYEGDQSRQVAIDIEWQMVENGTPTGEIFKYGEIMQGIANNRNPIGLTIQRTLPTTGQFRFRVKRSNDNGRGQGLIDDVTFESAYSYYQSTKTAYPLDTIARLRRMAIGSGTNASELNLIAKRKLNTPSGFVATSNFADIVLAMATDPYIGRMRASEVDSGALYALSREIVQYFGTAKACEFNYTFDDTNASYQEMVGAVAEAVFCNARRENGQHYFAFEKRTQNSLLLFNHRNMKPESLSVTELFGIKDNVQGIELKWRDPDDNYAESVIKLPNDLQTNYKTIETHGVTNRVQAHLLANRAWNKLKYGRKAIEFTAYGEADLVTRMDRIAVVDSTMPILCSGEVVAQDNLHLVLDYPLPASVTIGLTIHLQLKNGVVDVIDVARVIDDYTVELARLPMQPLVTNGVSHTTFAVTKDGMSGFDAYLIESKSANSLFESSINATRYDPRYYQNDDDYKRGLID